MTMFDLDPNRVTRVRQSLTMRASVRDGAILIKRRRREGEVWIDDPLVADDVFGADIWQMQQGWELWSTDATGKRQRDTQTVPMNQPWPETPTGGADIYVLPIYSAQWGGRADLVLDDAFGSEAIREVCKEMQTWPEFHCADPIMVPHLIVASTVQMQDGVRPLIEIAEWAERPERWGTPLVTPKPQETKTTNSGRRPIFDKLEAMQADARRARGGEII